MTDENEDIKEAVRERYAGFAKAGSSCCGPADSPAAAACTCGGEAVGYDPADLATLPDGADLGLGCGNPVAIAELRAGETVVDLGSGGGIDCFLASKMVGPAGRVIGVDMTPEMVERAREAAGRDGYDNVEFRLGEIEDLPVEDEIADVVISNCVINLVPDKLKAFSEALRVLKAGGRLEVSDIVLVGEMPEEMRDDMDAYAACLAGAIPKAEYLMLMFLVGFASVSVLSETVYGPEGSPFASVHVSAIKGDSAGC